MSEKFLHAIEQIEKFGGAILDVEKGDLQTIVVPEIDVSPEEAVLLFNEVKCEKNNKFDIGFFNIADKIMAKNWEKFDDSKKSEIREKLLNFTEGKINAKAEGRFAALCVKVFQFSEKWEEFEKYIFSGEISSTKTKIFVRLMSAAEEEYIVAHFKEIVSFLVRGLPLVTPSLKDKLINVLSNIDSELAFETEPTLLDVFMESLISIMKEEPERQEFILPVANTAFIQAPKAAEIVPKSVTDAIAAIKDVDTAAPILALFPVFNSEEVIMLVTKLIAVAETLISQNQQIPTEFLTAIEESPIEKLAESVQQALAEFFSSVLETTASAANVSIFAPLAAQVADVYEKEKFFNIVNCCFKGTGLQLSAALYIYQCVADYIENLSFEFPQSVMTQITTYFGNSDAEVRMSAFQAARALLCNKFELEQETCQNLVDAFQSVPESDFYKYFKVLREAFRAECNDAVLCETALPFALEGLKNEKQPRRIAEYLSIFANIANIDPEIVEPHANAIVSAGIDLMKGDDPLAYKFASRALLGLINDDNSRRRIFALLPRFQQLLANDSTLDTQVQGNVAAAYASIVIGSQIQKEVPGVVDIALRFTASKDDHLIAAGALLAEMVTEMIKLDTARNIFTTIEEAACTISGKEPLNNLLEALNSIFEKFKVEEKSLINLFNLFVKGEHPVFGGKPTYLFHDKDTLICSYIKNCVTRFPDLATPAAIMIIKWFSKAPMQMFPALLDIITTIVEMKKVEGDDFDVLTETLFQRIGTTHDEDLDEIMLGILMDLVSEKPESIDPQRFVSKFIIIYGSLDPENPTNLRACVSAAILDLCAVGADVEEEQIKDILASFPGQPNECVANEMGSSLVKMMTGSDKWVNLNPFVANVLSSVLLKSPDELNKYDFEKETIVGMKKVLKNILMKNKELERIIVKSFNKNRGLLNRFQKLMK